LLREYFGGFNALNPYISGVDISYCCVVCVLLDSLTAIIHHSFFCFGTKQKKGMPLSIPFLR